MTAVVAGLLVLTSCNDDGIPPVPLFTQFDTVAAELQATPEAMMQAMPRWRAEPVGEIHVHVRGEPVRIWDIRIHGQETVIATVGRSGSAICHVAARGGCAMYIDLGARLRTPVPIVAIGDTLLIAFESGWIAKLLVNGGILRLWHAPDLGRFLGVLNDGSFAAALTKDEPVLTGGSAFLPVSYLVVRQSAQTGDTLHAASSETVFRAGRRWDVVANQSPPWGRQPIARVVGGRLWLAPTDQPEVFVIQPSGEVVRRISWYVDDRSVLESSAGDWRRSVIPHGPDPAEVNRRGALAVIAPHAPGERYPVVGDIKVGSDDRIWILQRSIPGDTDAFQHWLALSAEGKVLARLSVPRGVTVVAFGADRVLALPHGSVGVIREYRIQPGQVSRSQFESA